MNTLTVIYIILAILFTSLLVYFQYFFKEKKHVNRYIVAFLRFVSILSIFLLLINPKVLKTNYENVKPKLLIAVDNSASIEFIKQSEQVKDILSQTVSSRALTV